MYYQEVHASSKCERALPGGHKGIKAHDLEDWQWCYLCTCSDPNEATKRRVNGKWVDV